MKLGVDVYSLRWQGWDAFEHLEYAAELGLDNVHFSERGYLASLEEEYLLSLKRRADALGLQIEVGMGSFDRYSSAFRPEDGTGEEQLSTMLRVAAVVRSPVVRCLLGSQAERLGPLPIGQHIEECVRTLKAVAPLARDLGVKLAIENHGGVDLLARELGELVEEAGPDYVGVCLDTGNPTYAAEDPVVSAEVLAPYVVTSHVRDNRVWATEHGAMAQWVPVGQGNTDLRRIVAILVAKAPNAPLDLEIITGVAPKSIPYYEAESDFWRMYPNMLARDLLRFIAMARDGAPEPLEQLLVPPGMYAMPQGEGAEPLVTQQRRHFEESVRYAREVLGLGERRK